MSYSKEALKLGRIQLEIEALPDAAVGDLLRICEREGVSYESFLYLERVLLS